MQRERIVTGITAAAIPAAATTGMLLGFGVRLGAPTRVFSVIGSIVLGALGRGLGAGALATAGLILHLLVMFLCGVVYASLVGEANEHRIAWAISVAAAAVALAFVAARTFAGSIALVLTPENLIAIGVVIAICLPMGMRFAPTRL